MISLPENLNYEENRFQDKIRSKQVAPVPRPCSDVGFCIFCTNISKFWKIQYCIDAKNI